MTQSSNLYREIHEQPEVLNAFLSQERAAVLALAKAIRERNINFVMIAGRGTSDNAGRYANYLFGAVNRLPVALATPSLFSLYQQPPRLNGALVLGISQSGKSPDIVAVLAEARRQGALTAAITNFSDSDLAQQADHVIQLRAGVEQSLAATKTYTSELAAIALLSTLLAENEEMAQQLARIPDAVAVGLGIADTVAAAAERYRYMRYCVVIGRGYNYASAFELALKLKELTYTAAEPYSSADFLHGPLALIEPGYPAFVFAPTSVLLPELQHFLRTLHERAAEPIVISNDEATLALGRVALPILVDMPEWLSPITAIIPGQLFGLYLALARDLDPDRPRALKKVTETH